MSEKGQDNPAYDNDLNVPPGGAGRRSSRKTSKAFLDLERYLLHVYYTIWLRI